MLADHELRACARRYAGLYLQDMMGPLTSEAADKLASAAVAYAQTIKPKRKGRAT